MNLHGRPTFLHRPSLNEWTPKRRLAIAISTADRKRLPKSPTLPKAPWDQGVQNEERQSKPTLRIVK